MASSKKIKYAAELVTFFHPMFWDVSNEQEIVALARNQPQTFWNRILDAVAAAEVSGVELTFAPFHWQEAVETYGGLTGLTRALDTRGLSLSSGFFAELEHGSDLLNTDVQAQVLDRAARYAEVIAAGGG